MIKPVAYEISYFFDRTGLSPESLLDAAAEWLRGSGLDASVGDVRRGTDWDLALDWIAADLRISAESTGISIEIHRDDPITGQAWREASAAEGAPVRDDVTGLCVLTLSGEVHDGAIQGLRDYWCNRMGASEFDEMDGFTLS